MPKSAFCKPADRPKAVNHYETIAVDEPELGIDKLTLVDDVVTRGATLLGAANRLADSYPEATIRAFALVRAISRGEIETFINPVQGTISLDPDGDTTRDP